MKPSVQLSDLQLDVLRVIWSDGEATVAKVHSELLPKRGLATTTIATVLTRLEKRGVLNHRREGRQFVYRTLITEKEAAHNMVTELTERVFSGNAAELITYLINEKKVNNGDLEQLRQLINQN